MLIRRKKFYFIISIILGCILAYSAVQYRSIYTENPFNRVMSFKQPVFATSDNADNIYLIDDSMKRVMKVDSRGQVIFTLNGGEDSSSGFYSALELDVDSSGNIYLLNNVLDDNGQYVEKEEIIRYAPDGKFKDIIYSVEYAGDERPIRTGNLCSISIEGQDMYCYGKKQDSFILTKISLETKEAEDVKTVNFADAGSMIVDFATAYHPLTSFFTTKRGEIYKSESSGGVSLFYSGNEKSSEFASSIPWEVEIDNNNILYFSDLLQKSIRSIDSSGKIDTLLSGDILKKQGYDGDKANFYRISVNAEGTAVSVCNENVVRCSSSASIGFYSDGGLFPTGVYMWRFFVWLQLLLLIAVIVYAAWYVFVNILKGKPSAVLMQSLFVIAVIIIATFLVSNMIFSSFQNRYETEVFNRISQTMYLTSKNIDGNVFEKIKKPEHFMNEDYKLIREQLHSSFNYNRDTWNEGFYGALYTVVDDKLYAVMYYDDSKCPFYPIYEDGSEQDYLKVFKEKTMITTKSSDAEGDWMYGMVTLSNSAGKVVGILEIGTDLYGFKQENNRLKNDILLKTATFLVVLVFVMIEITIFADLLRRRRNHSGRLGSEGLTSMDTLGIRPVCFLIYTASFLSGSFVPILMKQLYQPLLGLPENVVLALPISAEAAMLAVSSVIGGYAIDKKGWKPSFMSGLILLLFGQVMSGFASSPLIFIFSRAVAGAGMGLSFLSLQNYVVLPASEEERNEGIAALNSGGFAGVNSGLIIGGMLAEKVGFSKVYFFSAALVVICALVSFKSTRNARALEKAEKGSGSLKSLINFFSTRAVVSFFLLVLVPTVVCTMFIDYFFPLFAEGEKMSPSSISRAFLLNGLSIIYIGPVLSGYISKRLGVRLSMLLAALVMAAALLQFAVQGTLLSALIAILLIGIAESFGITMRINYFSSVDAVDKLGHGKALGYYGLVENFGQAMGPIIYGMVLGFGILKGIGLIGISFIAIIVLFSILTFKKGGFKGAFPGVEKTADM